MLKLLRMMSLSVSYHIPFSHQVCDSEEENVATTSYFSPAMLELEKEAKEAGITVMNEIGLGKEPPCRPSYQDQKLIICTKIRDLIMFAPSIALNICIPSLIVDLF